MDTFFIGLFIAIVIFLFTRSMSETKAEKEEILSNLKKSIFLLKLAIRDEEKSLISTEEDKEHFRKTSEYAQSVSKKSPQEALRIIKIGEETIAKNKEKRLKYLKRDLEIAESALNDIRNQ
jgi:hypothetical protein